MSNRGGKSGGKKFGKFIIPALAAIAVTVILAMPKSIKEIDVSYVGNAQSRASALGFTDSDFIRASGLTGHKTNEIEELRQSVEDGMARTGYFVLNDIKKTSRTGVTICVEARMPYIVVSSNGRFYTLDRDCYVLRSGDKPTDGGQVIVNGVTLVNPVVGAQTVCEGTDKRLESALQVAEVIIENGYLSRFPEITVQEDRFVYINSSSGVPVLINLRFDIQHSLEIAATILKEGVSGGSIKVAGENGYFIPDTDTSSGTKGM